MRYECVNDAEKSDICGERFDFAYIALHVTLYTYTQPDD